MKLQIIILDYGNQVFSTVDDPEKAIGILRRFITPTKTHPIELRDLSDIPVCEFKAEESTE